MGVKQPVRKYVNNLDYIDALIENLQSRHSSPVERRAVNANVDGSTPSGDDFGVVHLQGEKVRSPKSIFSQQEC